MAKWHWPARGANLKKSVKIGQKRPGAGWAPQKKAKMESASGIRKWRGRGYFPWKKWGSRFEAFFLAGQKKLKRNYAN